MDSQQGVHYIDNKDSLLSNPYLNKKYKRPGKQWKNKLERHEEQDWKENSQLLDKPRWQSKGWNGWKSKPASKDMSDISAPKLPIDNNHGYASTPPPTSLKDKKPSSNSINWGMSNIHGHRKKTGLRQGIKVHNQHPSFYSLLL